MAKYNHPTKRLNWFFRKFENSPNIHPLKTISRLVGVLCLIVAFFFTNNDDIMLAYFAGGILVTDILFFILRKKESHYKTVVAFQRMKGTPKKFDKYNHILLAFKAILFLMVPIAPATIPFYGILCLILPPIVAGELKLNGWVTKAGRSQNFFESGTTIINQKNNIWSDEQVSYHPYPMHATSYSNLGMYTGGDHFSSSSH